jgi:hypothetical protein
MKQKEEILFSYMDEALQVSTENQLKAMQGYADEMVIEFVQWYLKGRASNYEILSLIDKFKFEVINDKEPF